MGGVGGGKPTRAACGGWGGRRPGCGVELEGAGCGEDRGFVLGVGRDGCLVWEEEWFCWGCGGGSGGGWEGGEEGCHVGFQEEHDEVLVEGVDGKAERLALGDGLVDFVFLEGGGREWVGHFGAEGCDVEEVHAGDAEAGSLEDGSGVLGDHSFEIGVEVSVLPTVHLNFFPGWLFWDGKVTRGPNVSVIVDYTRLTTFYLRHEEVHNLGTKGLIEGACRKHIWR